jgi:putative transposase
MSRPPRISLENFTYHIINRGNNGQAVFHDEDDFAKYLGLLMRYKEKFVFKIYAYCLMSNHVHIIIQPTQANTLSKIMQSLTTAHTKLHHYKYRTSGHLWQGRFKNPIVQSDTYLLECIKYIEFNPVRANIVQTPLHYKWSSVHFHTGTDSDNRLLDLDPVFTTLGNTTQERHDSYVRFIQQETSVDIITRIKNSINSGLFLADGPFEEGMRERLRLARPSRRGRPRKRLLHNYLCIK